MTVERGTGGEVQIERIRAELSIKLPQACTQVEWTPLLADFSAMTDPIVAPIDDHLATLHLGDHPTIWFLVEAKL